MNKKTIINIILSTTLISGITFAEEKVTTTNNTNDSALQTQKVIEDYKNYVSTISPSLREEIINFRKEIAKLNKQKRDLYAGLSQEAQSYLAKAQEYRKRLPIKQKGLINIETPGEKSSKPSNTDVKK